MYCSPGVSCALAEKDATRQTKSERNSNCETQVQVPMKCKCIPFHIRALGQLVFSFLLCLLT